MIQSKEPEGCVRSRT